MQSIKGTLLLLTLCLGAGGVWGKPSWAVFEDVWGDLADGGKGIIEGLRNATKDGAALGKDVIVGLENGKGKFLNDLSQLGEDLSNAITESLTTGLKDLSLNLQGNITILKGAISIEKNLLKKRALLKGLAALEELNSVANQLQAGLLDLNNKLAAKVNTQLNATLSALVQWGNEQLERVNIGTGGAGVAQAKDIINLLIERYTSNIAGALVELEVLKSQFEQQLNDKISEYTGYARDLIDSMKRCGVLSTLRCQSKIEEGIENLLNAKNELEALLKKSKDLLKAGVYASSSLTSLLKQLAKDKLACEKQLDDIIKENPTSTTAATTTTTSDGGSSGSNDASTAAQDGSTASGDGGQSDGASTESDGSSNDSDSSSGLSQILGGWVNRLDRKSKSLLEGIWNATAAGKDLLDGLNGVKGSVLEGVVQLVENLSNALYDSLVTSLGDLSSNLQGNITELEAKIKAETSALKKKALNNGLTALKNLNSTVIELKTALAVISIQLGAELNAQVEEAITNLGEWADEQLDRVNKSTNGAGLSLAVDVVKLLTERYARNLIGTLKEFEVLKAEFDLRLNRKIDEYTRDARLLINNLNRCLLKSITVFRCQTITEDLSVKLNLAQNELQNLLRMSKQMLKAGVTTSKAIASVLKQLAKDKLKCEKELDNIIEENPSDEATTADTTAASEDTTAASEDTTAAGEDTTAAGEDTTVGSEDTTAAGEDTTAAGEDTTAAGEDTTVGSEDTTVQ